MTAIAIVMGMTILGILIRDAAFVIANAITRAAQKIAEGENQA